MQSQGEDNPGVAPGLEIALMCKLAGVSRAGYYRHWRAHAPREEETALRDEIQCLSLAQRFYGYRRITALLRQSGWSANHKRVQRIRQTDNLLCLSHRTFRPATTDSRHKFRVYPNLARRLVPTAINQLWVADITYVRLREEFVYLAVVLDGFSRRVIGWHMANHLQASLALAALDMALASRTVVAGELVHHSDRGVQYACSDYVGRLAAAGIQPSMSRAGCPWDNAMAESFMRTLKHEEVDGSEYRDQEDAKARIGTFLDKVYNGQRLHSALDYQPPAVFEGNQRQVPCLPHAAGTAPVNEPMCA